MWGVQCSQRGVYSYSPRFRTELGEVLTLGFILGGWLGLLDVLGLTVGLEEGFMLGRLLGGWLGDEDGRVLGCLLGLLLG